MLGGGGITEHNTVVLGGGGIAEQDTVVLGGGGMTGPSQVRPAGSSAGAAQSQLTGSAPGSILLIVRPKSPFRNCRTR